MNKIIAYTDGSCLGNPGAGGWGVYFPDGVDGTSPAQELSGGVGETTNNRMELQAAIEALRAAGDDCGLIIFADSEYVVKGITQWLEGWKNRAWRTSARKPVENQDLWKTLDQLCAGRNNPPEWRWVRAHNENLGNERADALARAAAEKVGRGGR